MTADPAAKDPAATSWRARLRPWLGRARLVALHSFHSLIAPLLAAAISAWVVRTHSPSLWGAFVDVLLVVQLGAHVLAFGNKELLLRAFAEGATDKDPYATVPAVFQGALATRAVTLLPPVLAATAAWAWWRDWPASWLAQAALWLVAELVVQSHGVIILYARRFTAGVAIEATATLLSLGLIMLINADLSVFSLVAVFTLTTWGKAALLSAGLAEVTGLPTSWRTLRTRWVGQVRPAWLGLALPFFVMGLTGMLQSRLDLYVMTAERSAAEVGRYQVMINLLIYLQTVANLVLVPFVQDLYRMPTAAMRRVARWLALGGAVFALPATALAWWALAWVWRVRLGWPMVAVAAGYVWVVWLYLPDVYTLYKLKRERTVLVMNAVGAGLNLALNLWWVPRYGALGALSASLLVQAAGVLVYRVVVARAAPPH